MSSNPSDDAASVHRAVLRVVNVVRYDVSCTEILKKNKKPIANRTQYYRMRYNSDNNNDDINIMCRVRRFRRKKKNIYINNFKKN